MSLLAVAAIAAALPCILSLFGLFARQPAAMASPELFTKLTGLEEALKALPAIFRDEGRLLREDVRGSFATQQQTIDTRLATFAQGQVDQLTAMRTEASDGRAKLEEALKADTDAFAKTQTTRLGEANQAMKDLADKLEKAQEAARFLQQAALAEVATKIQALTEGNEKKQDAIREALTKSLDELRKGNEEKLEKMRETVDEKLQGTLEARLGASFKQVSDGLEQVHKGLGEMQALANGVGDLKRVLTNVKSRGAWGEVQLGILLEDMLTPDQFETNVRISPTSGEVVEFAIRLPGREGDVPVYVPIDAKFPQEDYERLLMAQETGVVEEVEKNGQALERAIRLQARTISEKYIHPPHSTDFAIMYLPTEGLFSEVIRRPGLCSEIQTKHRVVLTGPTTLSALLSSLQTGFRTLAIEKRSSEVWKVLSAAKDEFRKYGQVWDRLGKQLATAQATVSDAGVRTRAIERQLREVETAKLPPGMEPLMIADALATDLGSS